jgi:hypothetical protein
MSVVVVVVEVSSERVVHWSCDDGGQGRGLRGVSLPTTQSPHHSRASVLDALSGRQYGCVARRRSRSKSNWCGLVGTRVVVGMLLSTMARSGLLIILIGVGRNSAPSTGRMDAGSSSTLHSRGGVVDDVG